MTRITTEAVGTLGTLLINILKSATEFHAVPDVFCISTGGILVRTYLRQEQAQLSFRHNTLVVISEPITPIPFIVPESQQANEILKPEIKLFSRILKLRARSKHTQT